MQGVDSLHVRLNGGQEPLIECIRVDIEADIDICLVMIGFSYISNGCTGCRSLTDHVYP